MHVTHFDVFEDRHVMHGNLHFWQTVPSNTNGATHEVHALKDVHIVHVLLHAIHLLIDVST